MRPNKLVGFRTLLICSPLLAWSALTACSSDGSDTDATAGSSGAGATSHAGSGGAHAAGAAGHNAAGTSGVLGEAGADPVGGASQGGSGGVSIGAAGEAGANQVEPEACLFHSDAPGSGEAGAAGAPSGPDDVKLTKSATIGSYLTDKDGHTLYVFGSDVPGDCNNAPVSVCTGSPCTMTWKAFSAGDRNLPPGVDDAAFGDFLPTGALATQSTYNGWPLYTYINEVPGALTGQGIAALWHAVTVPFYNVMLMKKKLSDVVSAKYLADGAGLTLYTNTADTVGAAGTKPVSACVDKCMQNWPPFSLDRFVLPSSFVESDFSVFVRPDRQLQVAYRGKPLYRYVNDAKPGDTLGNAVKTFVLADPAL